jgi:hypothetical protein
MEPTRRAVCAIISRGARLIWKGGGQDDLKNNGILPALVGLTIAWDGTVLLLSPADRLLVTPGRLTTRVLEQ